MNKTHKKYTQFGELTFHILFWISHFLYRIYLLGFFHTYDFSEFYIQLILLPVRILATYFTIYIVIRHYLFKKRFLKFFIWLIFSIIATLLINRVVQYYIIYGLGLEINMDGIPFWSFKHISHSLIYIYPIITLAAIIFFIHEWFKKEKSRLEIQKEKLETELKYLKNQINPHFLFNTINNIYSLALEKSSKAPDALLKLSDMLNYLLYESNTNKIELKKEIINLKDYIELEQFRYGNKLEVIFNYEVESLNIEIPPLLLLPFVENAYKHGASESLEKSWIHINLVEKNGKITFKVENSISKKIKEPLGESNGIGLTNVQKRLELMYFNKHQLKILNSTDSFLIILELNLNNE